MNRKRLTFLLVIMGAGLLIFALMMDKNNLKSGLQLRVRKVTKNERKVAVVHAPVRLEYTSNAVITGFDRNELSLTMYLSGKDADKAPHLKSEDVAAWLEWNGQPYIGDSEVIPFGSQRKRLVNSIVMDYSTSMFGEVQDENGNIVRGEAPIYESQKAVHRYLDNFCSGDMAEIIKFGQYVDFVQYLTSDRNQLYYSVYRMSESRGGTALFDAIDNGLNSLSGVNGNKFTKAVVAFADGDDNYSSARLESVIQKANSNCIPVFTIGLKSFTYTPNTLKDIAEKSGGLFFETTEAKELTKIYQKINTSLRNSYLIKVRWKNSELPPRGQLANFVVKVLKNDAAIIQYKKDNITIP